MTFKRFARKCDKCGNLFNPDTKYRRICQMCWKKVSAPVNPMWILERRYL